MIPEASTHLIISEAIEDLIPSESQSIEAYAEGLIDDLFTDIDNILDTGNKQPAKSLRTEYAPMQAVTVKMHKVVLPQTTVNRPVTTISKVTHQQPSTLVFNPPTVTAVRERKKKNTQSLSNLFILGTTVSMAIVGTMYFTESGFMNGLSSNAHTNQIQSTIPIKPDPNAELVDYMLSALTVIDQQQSSNQQKTISSVNADVNKNATNSISLPNNPPIGNLTPPLSANNTSPIPSPVTNVVERIYIPVYKSPPSVRPLPEVSSVTAQVSAPEFVQDTPENVQSTNKPSPEKSNTTAELPAIAPPKLPTPTTAQQPTSVPTTTQEIYLPAYSAELEGLLELGEKSAALFKIDGVTRRIKLGESIGATGWTLVEVSNGEAIIRRNGEVRSIYTGQKL
jgi:hypothetical protein